MKKKIIGKLLALCSLACSIFLFSACSSCGEEECAHKWGEWSVSARSTCTTQGTKNRKCTKCNSVQTDFLDIGEHQYDGDNVVWTWNGFDSATATLSCITDNTHIRQVNANITNEITKFSSCTEEGVKTYTATVQIDGNTYTSTQNEMIAPLGHTEGIDEAVAATCQQTGLTAGTHCSVCKEIITAQQEIPAIGHDYDVENIVWSWEGLNGATATVSCLTDSAHIRTITANLVNEITMPATCVKEGVKTYTATVVIDGVEYKNTATDSVESNGHSWNDGEVTRQASAVADGEMSYECLCCPQTKTETFAYPLSREKWNKAFNTLFNLDNVTVNMQSEDNEGLKNVIIYRFDGTNKQGVMIDELENQEVYFTREANIDYRYGFYENEWRKSTTDKIINYSIRSVFAYEDFWDGIVAGYNSFVYYNEEKALVASNLSIVIGDQDYQITCSDFSIIFDGEKITRLSCVMTDPDNYIMRLSFAFQAIGETKVVLPHIHVWSDWREETVVSCTNDGLNIKICATCDETKEEIVYSEGHNYEPIVVNSTCEALGYTLYDCSECDDCYYEDWTDKLGHNWGEWEVSGTDTIRYCLNECDCGKNQMITDIDAAYNSGRLLTGQAVSRNNITVSLTLSDDTTMDISDYTLENDVMTVDGSNYVKVKFYSLFTKISVPAIYDNLPNATLDVEFTYTTKNDAVTITGFIGDSTDIIIPSYIEVDNVRTPVRYIKDQAFSGLENLTSVVIPNSVKEIGYNAFNNCKRLGAITFGKGLTFIGKGAFANCIGLTEVEIPKNVVTLETPNSWEEGVFENCNGLKKVTIGDDTVDIATTVIGERAFKNCTALEEVYIGNQVKTISESAFENCLAISSLNIGLGVQTIEGLAFYNCENIKSVVFPDSVMEIGYNVFNNCKRLGAITFGKGLTFIGKGAFANCIGLTEVEIPKNVVTLETPNSWEEGVFENCNGLKKVTIGDDTVDIATTVIGERAFKNCTALEEVYLGSNVKEYADSAFEGCSSLTKIESITTE